MPITWMKTDFIQDVAPSLVYRNNRSKDLRPHRLMVRSLPFQGKDTGSNPVGAIWLSIVPQMEDSRRRAIYNIVGAELDA